MFEITAIRVVSFILTSIVVLLSTYRIYFKTLCCIQKKKKIKSTQLLYTYFISVFVLISHALGLVLQTKNFEVEDSYASLPAASAFEKRLLLINKDFDFYLEVTITSIYWIAATLIIFMDIFRYKKMILPSSGVITCNFIKCSTLLLVLAGNFASIYTSTQIREKIITAKSYEEFWQSFVIASFMAMVLTFSVGDFVLGVNMVKIVLGDGSRKNAHYRFLVSTVVLDLAVGTIGILYLDLATVHIASTIGGLHFLITTFFLDLLSHYKNIQKSDTKKKNIQSLKKNHVAQVTQLSEVVWNSKEQDQSYAASSSTDDVKYTLKLSEGTTTH
ncbi:hypothetical protein HK099_004516 [Clydaea vesicula]|uniref:Uncharacterized protein n=1 Tax=Clydaea vesicula TaxID=447962 RepID=A0AAD5U6X0_9FUNG|nr:hypothetical protein HK099_004516 [Clydaea vesicula]